MSRHLGIFLLFLLLSPLQRPVDAKELDSLKWLPSGSLWKTTIFDPAAPQVSASLLAYQVEGSRQERVYSPINIATQQMVLRHVSDTEKGLEVGLEFGVHSQFTIVDSGDTYLGGLQNTDFRVGGILHFRNRNSVLRILLYHQSSHLGDDFMLRTHFFMPNSKVMNYEQLSFTRMHLARRSQYYYGWGFNVSPNTTRERHAFHGGLQYNLKFERDQRISYLCGMHLRLDEQNDYNPNLKAGIGVRLGTNTDNAFLVMLEYYQGNLPYSTLEFQKVRLYGLGVYFQL